MNGGKAWEPKFNVDDTARVLTTGDRSRWSHGVAVGSVVRLRNWDPRDGSWEVEETCPNADRVYPNGELFWVLQEEIEPDFAPVTDDEIQHLFGTTKEAT